jgi:glycosidase
MNYPVRVGIIDYIRDKRCDSLKYALSEVMFNTPKRIRDMQMNLLGTHDTERIITVLAGVSAKGKTNKELSCTFLEAEERDIGVRRVKLAYTLLATLPGIPTVFYGDEAGLEGYRDPFNRRPFPWNNINSELLEFYRSIGEIRSGTDVYTDGEFELVFMTESLLVFKRTKGNVAYATVVNNSQNVMNINFSKRAKELLSGESGQTFAIASECAAIFKINSQAEIKIV